MLPRRTIHSRHVETSYHDGVTETSASARTRRALVDAAQALLREGEEVTVQSMAERAGVSRATAYRYFGSNEAAMMAATIPNVEADVLAPLLHDATDDRTLPERGADLIRSTGEWAFDHEDELRGVLALTVSPNSKQRGVSRKGITNRGAWIAELLADLPVSVPPKARRRLAAALVPLMGADAVVWTTDVADLDRDQALDVMAWMAHTLIGATIDEYPEASRKKSAAARHK